MHASSPSHLALGAIFGDSDFWAANTIAGAGLGVVAAAITYKLTKNPLLVGLSVAVGVWGAYRGAEFDAWSERFQQPR